MHNVYQLKYVGSKHFSILKPTILIEINNQTKIFENVIPSKIFENVYHQKPILLGVKGEAKELIEKYKVGVCFDPENKSSFLTAIELVKTYSKSKKYAANCKKMLKLFDRKNLAKSMLEFIKY